MPEGKFGDEENSPNRDGATYCVGCPAGRYGGTKGLSDATCSGLCSPGYFALQILQLLLLIPAGKYTTSSGTGNSIGDIVTIGGCTDTQNNGDFKISAINIVGTSNEITVLNWIIQILQQVAPQVGVYSKF